MAVVVTDLRRQVPHEVVGWWFGTSPAAGSRELRAVRPAVPPCLPCPVVGEPAADAPAVPAATVLPLEQGTAGRVLPDATEQRVGRPGDGAVQRRSYSGKQQPQTRKTPVVTAGARHLRALSTAVPGATHDQTRCAAWHTRDRVPGGVAVDADTGEQGRAAQVAAVAAGAVATREAQHRPRVLAQTPHKQPRGGALTDEPRQCNRALGTIRIRVEHGLGWPKHWAILATRFRCAHGRYTRIMAVIGGLVNAQTARWQAARVASRAYSA